MGKVNLEKKAYLGVKIAPKRPLFLPKTTQVLSATIERQEMAEYYTPGFVLKKDVRNDKDTAYTLYTQKLGKVSAIAKSARKITSKLSGHLVLGRIADVRLIDKGSFQLLDALSKGDACKHPELSKFLNFLESMVPFHQPDAHIWHISREVLSRCRIEPIIYRELVGIMGFAPTDKKVPLTCSACKKKTLQMEYFYIPDTLFLCANCAKDVKIDKNDLVQTY